MLNRPDANFGMSTTCNAKHVWSCGSIKIKRHFLNVT